MAQHAWVGRHAHRVARGAVQPGAAAGEYPGIDRRAQTDRTHSGRQRLRVQLLEECAAGSHLRPAATPGEPCDPGAPMGGPHEYGRVDRGGAAVQQESAEREPAHRMRDNADACCTGARLQRLRGGTDLLCVLDVAPIAVAKRDAVHRVLTPARADQVVPAGVQHTRRVAPAGNEEDGQGGRRHYQLILPCCDVSISSVFPDLNRNASMLDIRNSRAG